MADFVHGPVDDVQPAAGDDNLRSREQPGSCLPMPLLLPVTLSLRCCIVYLLSAADEIDTATPRHEIMAAHDLMAWRRRCIIVNAGRRADLVRPENGLFPTCG